MHIHTAQRHPQINTKTEWKRLEADASSPDTAMAAGFYTSSEIQ